MPKAVTLIISFYNKIDYLKLVFAGLEQQSSNDFEVIIADDGSRPEVVSELKLLIDNSSFPVKHLWHEDNGWQKNTILNKAIVTSEADYIIFIDGDCIPNPHFIEEHLKSKTPNQAVCGRRVTLTKNTSKNLKASEISNKHFHLKLFFKLLIESILTTEKTHIRHMFRIRNQYLRRIFVKDKLKGILGCNFSVWKEDMMKINGFDERFIYPGMGEDSDIENRLRQMGVRLVSKKFYVTVYHIYHNALGPDYEMNYTLYKENLENKVIFTPYGILKNA